MESSEASGELAFDASDPANGKKMRNKAGKLLRFATKLV